MRNTWLRCLGVWLGALVVAPVAGCSCAAPTLGAACSSDRECSGGEICNPATMRCELAPRPDAGPLPDVPGRDAPGTDAPGIDTGGCVDGDGDGVTGCAGDCDDGDPLTYPGAPEACGDGVRNDCTTNMADAGCGGIGTYVAPPPLGTAANPGTQAAPVDTIAHGIMNAMTIGGGVDVYVAAGTYAEDVTMVEGISLLGGHESTGWTRDPAAHVTIIEAATSAGVTFPGSTSAVTEIDGFNVLGRSGTSSSAAITIANGSSGVVTDCIVEGGSTSGASQAVDVNPMDTPNTGTPTIRDSDLHVGASGTGWGGGNGGWGVRSRRTATHVERVHVFLANAGTIQRGIELVASPVGASVSGSLIEGTGTSDVTFGIRVASGAGIVDDNTVFPGRCSGSCLGIAIEGAITTAVVTNNVAFGGQGAMIQVGLTIAFEAVPTSTLDILVHSNFLDGGTGALTRAAGLAMGERPTTPLVVGRILNNVIRSGTGMTRYAFYEQHMNIDPMVFQNNALFLDSSGPGTGALYFDEGATGLTMVSAINALGGAGMNLDDDCSIVNPVPMGDYHLGAGSMCIDAGSSTTAPAVDFEGDARTGTPDIGPDET